MVRGEEVGLDRSLAGNGETGGRSFARWERRDPEGKERERQGERDRGRKGKAKASPSLRNERRMVVFISPLLSLFLCKSTRQALGNNTPDIARGRSQAAECVCERAGHALFYAGTMEGRDSEMPSRFSSLAFSKLLSLLCVSVVRAEVRTRAALRKRALRDKRARGQKEKQQTAQRKRRRCRPFPPERRV